LLLLAAGAADAAKQAVVVQEGSELAPLYLSRQELHILLR
jgi:hypothetical protein